RDRTLQLSEEWLGAGQHERGSYSSGSLYYAAAGTRAGRRARSTARLPALGLSVMLRRRLPSSPGAAGASSCRASTARSTIFISSWAKLAPRQRRRPPPNGIQV